VFHLSAAASERLTLKSARFCALSYALCSAKSTLGQINYGIAGEDHALRVIFVNHATGQKA